MSHSVGSQRWGPDPHFFFLLSQAWDCGVQWAEFQKNKGMILRNHEKT